MKEIKELVEHIEEEMEDAHKYARLAGLYKGKDDGLSGLYMELAGQEMQHMDKLHSKAQEIIARFRKEKGEPPEAMMAIWEWEHGRMMDKAGKIRAMLDMARK